MSDDENEVLGAIQNKQESVLPTVIHCPGLDLPTGRDDDESLQISPDLNMNKINSPYITKLANK